MFILYYIQFFFLFFFSAAAMAYDLCRSIVEDLIGQAVLSAPTGNQQQPGTNDCAPAPRMGTITLTLGGDFSSDEDDSSESRSSTPAVPTTLVPQAPQPEQQQQVVDEDKEDDEEESDAESMFLAISSVVGNYDSHPVTPARQKAPAAPAESVEDPSERPVTGASLLEQAVLSSNIVEPATPQPSSIRPVEQPPEVPPPKQPAGPPKKGLLKLKHFAVDPALNV